MFSLDLNYKPVVIIVDNANPLYNDLNLQIDDINKEYELECIVKVKSVTSLLENGIHARHQYVLELQDVTKFKEQID